MRIIVGAAIRHIQAAIRHIQGDVRDTGAAIRHLGSGVSHIRTPIRPRTVGALGAGCALLAVGAGASAWARSPAVVPSCSAAQTQVWLGLGLGGGTAGTTYYPLEFSNVSHRTCTLFGYPGVSAYRGSQRQIGPAARRNPHAHALVTLTPGATAHALLGIGDWGAVCSRPVTADGLRVYPPGQRVAHAIPFSFKVCAHRGVLSVGPVRAGVGIPGYTGP